jgi:predicted glycoside hydrolase/deacetylase ChbG (UPF0249 family)
MSERLLIINADDLGLAAGVSRGILDLAERGGISSASLLANMPGSEWALARASAIGLDVGVHLNLCVGAPLTPARRIASLLGREERFAGARTIARRWMAGTLRLDEVEREWTAQLEWVLARGGQPSHLDTHCHTHGLPALYPLILRLARRYGIRGVRPAFSGFIYQPPRLAWPRIRMRPELARRRSVRHGDAQDAILRPAHFAVLTAMGMRSVRPVRALLHVLPPGVTELIAHPGFVDDELRRIDPLTAPREREWRILAEPALLEAIALEGIRLISWADVAT